MMQSHQFLLPNPSIVDPISPNNRFSGRISCTFVHLDRFQFQIPYRKSIITCARNGSSKGFFVSQRSRKTLVKLALFAASNLHYVLPEPLNSVIREFGGGDGGGGGGGGRSGGGSWKGFGWGGFDGRKRRVNKKLGLGFWIWGFTVVCCLGFWGLILGGELELGKDVILGALCLSMFLVLVRNGCVPEWLLGFCSGAAVVGVSIHKRDELQRLIKGFKAMGMAKRRQKGRRII